jgi:ABC-2 type transport system ATP-binding protein
MRQRLAVARALLTDPEVLILDEPTKSLDPLGAVELRDLLAAHASASPNRVLLLATHQLEEALDLCQRVCIVDHGCVRADMRLDHMDGSVSSVMEAYRNLVSSADCHGC